MEDFGLDVDGGRESLYVLHQGGVRRHGLSDTLGSGLRAVVD